ncbi:protein I'm not dead yet-like [Choristoneura fumiferana]|uniref:protein I'm not dead yet-like n=1 Tax=Choristoneura fumiferana TaxID=7141 RepID=UPI003D15EA7D
MGGLIAAITGPPQTPIKGFLDRIKNILKYNSRGIIGVVVAAAVFLFLFDPHDKAQTVGGIWFAMFWFLLLQPIAIQPVGLIPLFAFPMFGILSSADTCAVFFNENVILMFVGGWLHLVLNNCGMDKRLVSYFLCAGGDKAYSAKKILLKSMIASFFVSAISNRLMVTSIVLENILPPISMLTGYAKNEVDYAEFKIILCNAVAVSSTLGSMCIVHASLITLQLKIMFCEIGATELEYPDLFNYLQYSAYAVPTAIIMLIVNFIYHVLILKFVVEKKPMSNYSMGAVKTALAKSRSSLGKMSSHEKVSTLILIVSLACFFTRWSKWLGMGWATFRKELVSSEEVPAIRDATTAAIFVMALHFIPKSLNFLKIMSAKTKNDLPPAKMESGILFWKYIDKNTDYSYFLLMGGSVALYMASVQTALGLKIASNIGDSITGMGWDVGILIVILGAAFLGTIMSGTGAQAVYMPLIINMGLKGQGKWPLRTYLAVLGAGLGTGLGFSIPFLHTTCYYSKTLGKVTSKKQIKYGVPSTIICAVVLWVTLCFYAPILWDPDDYGIIAVVSPNAKVAVEGGGAAETTTAAAPAPPPEE